MERVAVLKKCTGRSVQSIELCLEELLQGRQDCIFAEASQATHNQAESNWCTYPPHGNV
jgi:hypothetical protein